MGQQIIKQPDGRYALFSSVSDTLFWIDATADQIVKHYVDEAAKEAERRVRLTLETIDRGEPAYHQFGITLAEAVKTHRRNLDNSTSKFNKAVEALAKRFAIS